MVKYEEFVSQLNKYLNKGLEIIDLKNWARAKLHESLNDNSILSFETFKLYPFLSLIINDECIDKEDTNEISEIIDVLNGKRYYAHTVLIKLPTLKNYSQNYINLKKFFLDFQQNKFFKYSEHEVIDDICKSLSIIEVNNFRDLILENILSLINALPIIKNDDLDINMLYIQQTDEFLLSRIIKKLQNLIELFESNSEFVAKIEYKNCNIIISLVI